MYPLKFSVRVYVPSVPFLQHPMRVAILSTGPVKRPSEDYAGLILHMATADGDSILEGELFLMESLGAVAGVLSQIARVRSRVAEIG